MSSAEPVIRVATLADAEELLDIYRPYVEETAISFECDVPSKEEFCARMERTLHKYPYFVIEVEGSIKGYACAGPFVGREAYERSAETTIYLAKGCTGIGYGRMLYETLERALGAMNIVNLYACIAEAVEEDEHLTNNSVEFHAHMGYEIVGRFTDCGYKFGKWYTMVWMGKTIGDHEACPSPVVPFPELIGDRDRSEEVGEQGRSEEEER